MATLASLETLVTKQSAYFYAQGHANEAREESRLFGAAVDAGMDREHDDLHGWVAEREADYRRFHDLSGPSDSHTGRAWDLMRRSGDRARLILRKAHGEAL